MISHHNLDVSRASRIAQRFTPTSNGSTPNLLAASVVHLVYAPIFREKVTPIQHMTYPRSEWIKTEKRVQYTMKHNSEQCTRGRGRGLSCQHLAMYFARVSNSCPIFAYTKNMKGTAQSSRYDSNTTVRVLDQTKLKSIS